MEQELKDIIAAWLKAHDAIIALHKDGMSHRDYAGAINRARKALDH